MIKTKHFLETKIILNEISIKHKYFYLLIVDLKAS